MASHLRELGIKPGVMPEDWELPMGKAYDLFMNRIFDMVDSGDKPFETLNPDEQRDYLELRGGALAVMAVQQQAEMPLAA